MDRSSHTVSYQRKSGSSTLKSSLRGTACDTSCASPGRNHILRSLGVSNCTSTPFTFPCGHPRRFHTCPTSALSDPCHARPGKSYQRVSRIGVIPNIHWQVGVWSIIDLWECDFLDGDDGAGCTGALVAGILPQEADAVLQQVWRLEHTRANQFLKI